MKIKTVSTSKQGEFEDIVNSYLKEGYKLLSSNCGFINSENYDFVDCWQAILYKEN